MSIRKLSFVLFVMLLCLCRASAQLPPPASFHDLVPYTTPPDPVYVAVGDFNGDSKQDLAVAANCIDQSCNTGSALVVFLGNGDGTFQPGVTYPAGFDAYVVTAADVNHDGKLDLVVGSACESHNCQQEGAVFVFLGNGDGSFQPGALIPTNLIPISIQLADLNGDGKLDMVTTSEAQNFVSVLLGNGDGTFQSPVSYPSGRDSFFVALGDFNHDGKIDMAVTNSDGNTVSILLGNGNGTFQAPVSYTLAGDDPYAFAIAVGDVNADGKLDLAVSDLDGGVDVLLGNGNGTFQPAVRYGFGSAGDSVAIGDFNGDGKPDLAVSDYQTNNAYVLLGNGDGTFGSPQTFAAGTNPETLAAGDFNGDGKLDLGIADVGGGLAVLLNSTGEGPAVVYNPPPNSMLSGPTVTFQWTPSDPATAYVIDVGSVVGGNQYYHSATLSPATLSATIDNLPVDGSPVYVTMYSQINAQWVNTSTPYTAYNANGNQGFITYPSPGSYLLGTVVQFVWNPAGGSSFALDVGSSPGGSQYYSSGDLGFITGTTVSGLPADGSMVYVTLYSKVFGQWYHQTYTYQAFYPPYQEGVLYSPAPGSTLPGANVPFTWQAGYLVDSYWLDVGNVPAGNQYYSSGALTPDVLNKTATGLPTDGSTVYVTLYSQISGVWYYTTYTYQAFSQASLGGQITTPAPGSSLTSTNVTFTWTPGTGVSAYWLDVGSSPGGTQYYNSGDLGPVLSTSVTGLPTDGSTIYVTLFSKINGTWYSLPYTYTAFQEQAGAITSPPSGSRLPGSTVQFRWTAGNGNAYQIDIGNTPGGTQYYSSGNLGNVLTTTVNGLPTDSSTVYVTLYTQIFGQWYPNSYTYQAFNPNGPVISFRPPVSYNAQVEPSGVVIADMNGDGKRDVVVSNFCNDDACSGNGSVTVLLGNGDGTLQPGVSYDAGLGTLAVATGDFNHDGKLDVVAVNNEQNSVSVFLGNGDGTLRPSTLYVAGSGPTSVAVGDFNHDGKLDLAVTNGNDNTVSILLGNGSGTFQAPVNYAVNAPYSVAVGDFNGDGKLDLAVADISDNTAAVLLGNGDGTFQAAVQYPADSFPDFITVADLNGDGKLDLVVANEGSNDVTVLLGNGNGTFRTGGNYPVGSYPTSLAVSDFDGDGTLDIAVANYGDNTVGVLGGNGDGTFRAPLNFDGGPGGYALAAGDLNGDGRPDIAVADIYAGVSILLSALPGPAVITNPAPNSTLTGSSVTFQWSASGSATGYWIDVGSAAGGSQYFQSGSLSTSTLSMLVNGLPTDGSTVYVTMYSQINGQWVSNAYTYTAFGQANSLGVLTTPAPGSMLPGSSVTFAWTAGSGATGYWLDIGSTPGGHDYYQSNNLGNVLTTTVNSLPTDGSTVYVTLYSYIGGQWLSNAYTYTAFSAASGQGVLTTPAPGSTLPGSTVTFGWTAGTGATSYWLDIGSAPGGNQYLQSGDLGNVLTVTANNLPTDGSTVYVTLYTKIGGTWYHTGYMYTAAPLSVSFVAAPHFNAGNQPESIATADFNHDGKLDLAVLNYNSQTVTVFLGDGDGTFVFETNYAIGREPNEVLVGDFNRDGKADLVVANGEDNTISVLLGNGDGTFQTAVTYSTGGGPRSIVIADLNRDGKLDLAIANQVTPGTVSILLGNGDGTFQPAVNYSGVGAPTGIAAADLNGDGKLDLVVAGGYLGGLSVLLGNGDGSFQPTVTYHIGTHPWAVAIGDFNGDGKPDVAFSDESNNNVNLLLGKGDGSFQAPVAYGVGSVSVSLVVRDFTGDGKLDIAAAAYGAHAVAILVGNGDGTFQPASSFQVGTRPVSLAVGDLNGDNKPDLAVADEGGGVSILLNTTPY